MLKEAKHIYFLGIGGIGMSALARYFKLQGKRVSGYDKTPSPLTHKLESEGIEIHYEDWGSKILDNIDIVVYTPAIPTDLQEFVAVSQSEIPMFKRAKILGEISKDYFTIAVAGTHGKTTITSMVSHFLNDSGIEVNAFIGGISSNYNSNLILNKDAKIMVVEADEFDRSFLHLHPDIAIVSSMDADHLDIYENKDYLRDSFFQFIRNIKDNGKLIIHESLDFPKEFENITYTYGISEDANIRLEKKGLKDSKVVFSVSRDVKTFGESKVLGDFEMVLPGQHNMLNATAAIAVSEFIGVPDHQVQKAVSTYKGVKRRFEIRINTKEKILIDDYAHHPTEIYAAIEAARYMFKGKSILGVFQPHLFSRTRDFSDEFSAALSQLDSVILLDIYPARELPIEGVNSQMILDKISLENKFLVDKNNLPQFVGERKEDVILIMGAGDIDRLVTPIENILINNA